MSSYLSFRKGGINLCSFSRSTRVYQAFSFAPYDNWKEVKASTLRDGVTALESDRNDMEQQIKILNEMLKHKLSREDMYETISSIQEYEEEIKEIDAAIVKVYFLAEIAEEMTSSKDYKMEWSID